MQRRVKTWGVVWGFAPLAFALACGGKQELQDVGDVGGSSGSGASGGSEQLGPLPDNGGSGGSGAGGSGGTGAIAGMVGFGGTSTQEVCFPTVPVTGNDPIARLELGPRNQVFGEVQTETEPMNYADQAVFGGTAWRINANYPAVEAGVAADTTLDLPAQLAEFPAVIAETRLMPATCEGLSLAGKTLRVKVWWKLGGAIVGFPTHGIALGAGEEPTWFEDSSKTFVVGDPEDQRVMNTLQSITLEQTFEADDETSPTDVFLTAWVMSDFEFPSTLYVGSIEWLP